MSPYAYVDNNAVMFDDTSGHDSDDVGQYIGITVGALFGAALLVLAGVAAVKAYRNYRRLENKGLLNNPDTPVKTYDHRKEEHETNNSQVTAQTTNANKPNSFTMKNGDVVTRTDDPNSFIMEKNGQKITIRRAPDLIHKCSKKW